MKMAIFVWGKCIVSAFLYNQHQNNKMCELMFKEPA